MGKVFVTDAADRISLAITRSLGRKGIEVTVGDSRRVCLSRFSKYCKGSVLYPSPKRYPREFLGWLRNHLRDNKYNVLIPVDDIPLLIISKNKEELSQFCKIPVADFETIMKARNKKRTIEIAMKHNIPCPKTYFVEHLHELRQLSKNIDFPVVIKPQESSGARGLTYVRNSEELLPKYLAIHKHYELPLIQELIPPGAPKYCFSTVFDGKSEATAVFTQVAFRWFGGATTFSLGVESGFASIIERLSVKLLKVIEWRGVAEVEFLIDPRDNTPKLLEVNPRFWSWVQLAVSSGVDFPYLLYRMTMEEEVMPITQCQTGVKFKWLLPGDILVLLGLGNRFRANLANTHCKKTVYAILSKDDPKPASVFIISMITSLLQRKITCGQGQRILG